MYGSQMPWVELKDSIFEHEGERLFEDLLQKWVKQNLNQVQWVEDFKNRTCSNWYNATYQDLCQLYAISRISGILLTILIGKPSNRPNWREPSITLEEFNHFHESLGFKIVTYVNYHPFYFEIQKVSHRSDANNKIKLTKIDWPAFMLGDMMYFRGGAHVEGGSNFIEKEVAENSTLYWTYRHPRRNCQDLSLGWGSNSQWRTSFRRDYKSDGQFHYCVDAKYSLDENEFSPQEDLPKEVLIELVKNRCLIKTRLESSDEDLLPYEYRLTEKK